MKNNGLYEIKTKAYKFEPEWSIITYEAYHDYLEQNITDDKNEISDLIDYCNQHPERKNFKWSLEVGTVQFMAGIFLEQKEIRLASKHLSYELALIHSQEQCRDQNFLAMKDHTLALAELPLENTPTVIEFISHKHKLPLFNESQFEEVHRYADELGTDLIKHIGEYKQSFFEKISDFGLDLTANFMLVRIHLLKFLAILPNLNHDKEGVEVKRIFEESLRRLIEDSTKAKLKGLKGQKRELPFLYHIIIKWTLAVSEHIPAKYLARFIRFSVSVMAKRFIAGETIDTAKRSLGDLLSSERDATIDQLGELVVSNIEADDYTNKVIEIIEGLNQNITKGEKNSSGINKAHVSIKVSALCHDFKPQAFDYTYENIAPRLKRILLSGKENDVFVNIDAEHYHYRDVVLEVYAKVLLETSELADYDQTGIVVQAYLRDAYEHLLDVVALAKKRKLIMPIRLVKGAYWDAETIEAEAHNFLAPQFINKEETDIHFRQLIFKTLELGDYLQLAVASHNIHDHCFARSLHSRAFPNAPLIEHQCLHMTYEGLSVGLSKMKWATRNYIPVGNLLVGMAYLVRRIMENSSQVGVLTIMRSHKKGLRLKTPTQAFKDMKDKKEVVWDKALTQMSREFKNIYPIRTYLKHHFNRVDKVITQDLEKYRKKSLEQTDKKVVKCSSDPKIVLGEIEYDTPQEVDAKIEKLFKGYQNNDWKDSRKIDRFAHLLRLADLLTFNREELTSLIVFEAGKTLDEAIADVDEAIDFINFYVREQIELGLAGDFKAKGVVGVIAPWNFPIAICCGMTTAALCSGNSVIVKPAEQTSLIGRKFVQLCYEAGIPQDVLQMTFGEAEVGQAIVSHELIVGVVFTGSKAVGESIYRKLSKEKTSDRYDYPSEPKFAITEMGGKNAIIVTNNCELDETVSGILYSAFAHSGQKCSAASRIIIDEKIKDAFIQRFTKAVEDIQVGEAFHYATVINPLITQEDQSRVRNMAQEAATEVKQYGGRTLIDRSQELVPGHCVGPSVFEIPSDITMRKETIASKEVFGPLVHLIPYKELDEAIMLFNSTEYALTGGVFCQSQDDLDYIVPKLEAGNIYINRSNTGARVAIEPFGGFKMSGTGPKAGGKEYLSMFNRSQLMQNYQGKAIFDVDQEVREFLAETSKLASERRVLNATALTTEIIEHFEILLEEISEIEKNKLIEFLEALVSHEFNLHEKVFPNRDIPGQISFNQKDLPIGNGLIVDCSERISVDVLVDFLINATIGNGISLMTTNKKIYAKWKRVVEIAYKNGFSIYNISLSLLSKESLEKIIKEEKYQFILFAREYDDQFFQSLINNLQFDQNLTKIYYGGGKINFWQALDRYTHCRAFAINTMRHGAPLDLTL